MSICSSSSFWIPGLYLISHSGRNFLEFYCFVVDFLGVFLDLRGPEELAGILWRQMAVQCEVARLFKQIMLYKSQMAVSSLSYFILPKPTNVCCECPFFSFFFLVCYPMTTWILPMVPISLSITLEWLVNRFRHGSWLVTGGRGESTQVGTLLKTSSFCCWGKI